jgi:outer membrane protein TolC
MIKKMRVRIIVCLVVWGALSAGAETTNSPPPSHPLALRECIDLALVRNLDLQIQRLSGDIASGNLNGAYGPYIPTFSFEAKHAYETNNGSVDWKKQNPYVPYDLNTDSAGPSLAGQLPAGLSYDFSLAAGQYTGLTDLERGIRKTNEYFAEASVTLRQHLLKDFWTDQSRQTLLVRRKELKMSQQSLRLQIMKTVLAVELGYFDLLAAREEIRVEEKALELKTQLLSETQRRVQVGDLPPLDSEQAETQLQNTLTALAAAREAFDSRQNALKSLLTDDFRTWADFDLHPADPLEATPVEVNRSESFTRALKNRPDLQEARLAVEKNDVVVQFRYNQLFPSLDLIGRYGGTGSQPDFGTATSDALHFRYPEYYAGVVLSFPLSGMAERGNYKASKAAKQIAELQLKRAEQEVLLQVADLVNRIQSRFSQVGSTRKARGYAEAALGAEQKKLQNGLSTSFIVLQLQETLTSARMAEVQALADYNKVLAQLGFAEGSTMEHYRLVLETPWDAPARK